MYKNLTKPNCEWCVSYSKFCKLLDTTDSPAARDVFKLFQIREVANVFRIYFDLESLHC